MTSSGHGTAVLELSSFATARGTLDALGGAGWEATQQQQAITLTARAQHDLAASLAALQPLQSLVQNLEAVASLGGQDVRLRHVNGHLEVTGFPNIASDELFNSPPEVDAANRARDGDVDAAMSLPLEWRVTVDLALQRLAPSMDLRVYASLDSLIEEFAAASLQQLRRLIPEGDRRRVFLSLDGDLAPLHLGRISLLTVGSGSQAEALPPTTDTLPGENLAADGKGKWLRPTDMLPATDAAVPSEWAPVLRTCRAAAAVGTWGLLANAVKLSDTKLELDLLGFKRVHLALPVEPPYGLALADVDASLRLRNWALQEGSPDRLLAVRQVASLYAGSEALSAADDVRASAEVVYIGLRSDAVAEVVKSAREARSVATDVVRQAVKASQDLVKSATERFLAGLVAIGAVVIANASRNLPDDVSRDLMLLIAGFFGLLALFSLLVEGPLLGLPIKHLAAETRASGTLLTEEQRKEISGSTMVEGLRWRVKAVRIALPLVYVLATGAIAQWGYPSRFK